MRATEKGDAKQRRAAATATRKVTEGCPQDQDDQTSNNDDEEYKVEKEEGLCNRMNVVTGLSHCSKWISTIPFRVFCACRSSTKDPDRFV